MPVYNLDDQGGILTENACASLKGHDITSIDNSSPVGGGRLRELADIYVRNKENKFYSGAVNQGLMLHADEKWVCVSKNDIRVPPQWAAVAEDILKKNENVCSVHFRMIPYDQEFNPANDTWVGGKERWWSSSFFVVRIGQLYDSNLVNSYDDYDFWYRYRSRGFKQAYTNKAEYQHLDSSTIQKMPSHTEANKRNYEYFKQKHGFYPDIQFNEEFKEQMSTPWKPQP